MTCICDQGFIQALLQTFVFHEGLSFMDVGHNPKCVSTLTLAPGGSMGRSKPPVSSPLAISAMPGFQIAFP